MYVGVIIQLLIHIATRDCLSLLVSLVECFPSVPVALAVFSTLSYCSVSVVWFSTGFHHIFVGKELADPALPTELNIPLALAGMTCLPPRVSAQSNGLKQLLSPTS